MGIVIHYIKQILSFLSYPRWVFAAIGGSLSIKRTFFQPHCKIKNKGTNRIVLDRSFFMKSIIDLNGNNNLITSQGVIFNSEIIVKGDDNKIIISENTRLYNSKIYINASQSLVYIGKQTTIGGINIVSMGDGNSIEIGDNCMIAENVEIWNSDTHDIKDSDTGIIVNPPAPVVIGNNVWLGKNSTILKGSKIGSGAVVGMRAIVSGIIPESSVAVDKGRIIRNNITWDHSWSHERVHQKNEN